VSPETPSASPVKGDLPPQNRVGGFRRPRPLRARRFAPAALQPRRKNRPAATATASGVPLWPSRDPIGERGGLNLYGFINNRSISQVDYLGLCGVFRLRYRTLTAREPDFGHAGTHFFSPELRAVGYTLEYEICEDECCDNIKLVQVLGMSGDGYGNKPTVDVAGSKVSPAYLDAGGMPNEDAQYGYADAPIITDLSDTITTGVTRPVEKVKFHIEVCALCVGGGKYRTLGCARFDFWNHTRQIVPAQEGAETIGDKQGIELPAYNTQGEMWQNAMNEWEAANGTGWRR